ncbi:hypothetical protein [Rummeliibacillus stabekisii]|uniref:hypothetical protein n=1 Tax=Rummeliibacillus stabekisii TaxID=241244 RepID=UPI003711989B
MREISFTELLQSYNSGEILEDQIITDVKTGDRMTFNNGSLRYVTESEYITSTVALERTLLESRFVVESRELEELTFSEALEFLRDNKSILIRFKGIENLSEITDISRLEGFQLGNLLQYQYFIETEKRHESKGKLSSRDAYTILNEYYRNERPVAELAAAYGVTKRMIYYILDGTYWADVNKQFKNDFNL